MIETRWHVKAARLAAQYPHKEWSEICSMLAKGRRRRPKTTVREFTQRMEQLKLF